MDGAGFYSAFYSPANDLYAMQRSTLIVFRLEGVIADHRELLSAAQAEAAIRMGLEDAAVPVSLREEYRLLTEALACEAVRSGGQLFPGVTRMLDALSEHAVLAVISDQTRRYCEQCVETLGLGPWFMRYDGCPDPEDAAACALAWQREFSAQRIIMVGSSQSDVLLARSVRADVVCAAYDAEAAHIPTGADWTIGSPAGIAEKCLTLLGHTL